MRGRGRIPTILTIRYVPHSPPVPVLAVLPPQLLLDSRLSPRVPRSWREWCGAVTDDAMAMPLVSNRSLALQRDTPWLQMRAATLDTLEFVAPRAVPLLWRRGSTVLDVGAASGELTRFIARKYELEDALVYSSFTALMLHPARAALYSSF